MITVFIATATAKAVNLEGRLFMGISEVSAVIDPYRDNTASTVPVAWIAFVFRAAVKGGSLFLFRDGVNPSMEPSRKSSLICTPGKEIRRPALSTHDVHGRSRSQRRSRRQKRRGPRAPKKLALRLFSVAVAAVVGVGR
jgi:hypothetical protein